MHGRIDDESNGPGLFKSGRRPGQPSLPCPALPTFSSIVRRASRSSIRSSKGSAASQKGSPAVALPSALLQARSAAAGIADDAGKAVAEASSSSSSSSISGAKKAAAMATACGSEGVGLLGRG